VKICGNRVTIKIAIITLKLLILFWWKNV
jgi:hypothetical protein